MRADSDMVERDYTEAITKLAMIAVDVISENEGVPTHLVAMAIACRIAEQFPDVDKLVARAALDASGIGELVEAALSAADELDDLAQTAVRLATEKGVAGEFAGKLVKSETATKLREAIAALSRARATAEKGNG